MRPLAFLFALLPLCACAGGLTLTDVSPHLSPQAQIVWKVASNDWPKELWIYEKHPQSFSGVTVSNALLLGGFKLKPFPRSFSKPITLWDKPIEGDPQPDYLTIEPNLGLLSFRRQRHPVSKGDANPTTLVARTWRYASELGLNKAQLAQGMVTDKSVSLSRRLDGLSFREDMEGLSIQYGDRGEILFLTLSWPRLERVGQGPTASAQDITGCIRAFKTPVLPKNDEPDYFARVKSYASVRTLTITNVTFHYSEGKYGEEPDDTKPERFVSPVATLDAIADWGTSNALVRLASPALATEVKKVLLQMNATELNRP
jgi:hypothetical protein